MHWNWHKKENAERARPKNHEHFKLERNMLRVFGFLDAIAIVKFWFTTIFYVGFILWQKVF